MVKISRFLVGVKKGMLNFGDIITTIINSFLLTIVYVFGFGLTSILSKLVGKHFLDRKVLSKKTTYWSDLNLKKKPMNEYYRQF